MLQYNESDMYTIMNKGDAVQIALKKALKSISPKNILNDKIKSSLESLRKAFKETIIVKIVSAIEKNEVLIVNFDELTSLPVYMPFVKVKWNGKEVVIIDVHSYTSAETDRDGNIMKYNIDIPKLYCHIVPAYISLKTMQKNDTLPYNITESLANIWARMFCNTLSNNTIGTLQNHADRYEAFMYLSIKFFCLYYLETPLAVATKVAMSFINNKKSAYIEYIEDKLETKEIDPFVNFTTFVQTLFNNEITNIASMGGKANEVNLSKLLLVYRNQYSFNAFMSLCAPDYFLDTLINAFNRSNHVRDRGFEVIIDGNKGEYKREVPALLTAIYKEV